MIFGFKFLWALERDLAQGVGVYVLLGFAFCLVWLIGPPGDASGYGGDCDEAADGQGEDDGEFAFLFAAGFFSGAGGAGDADGGAAGSAGDAGASAAVIKPKPPPTTRTLRVNTHERGLVFWVGQTAEWDVVELM